jgi:hypothetical protein
MTQEPKSSLSIGQQVFYVPDYVPTINGFGDRDLDHPDVEPGFVSGVTPNFPNSRYCRYFHHLSRTGGALILRTVSCSQLTSNHQLVARDYTDQATIDFYLKQIEEDKL